MQNPNDPQLNTLDQLRIFHHANRVWRPYLSARERDFLFYLLDNTVCWGRTTLKATVDQLVSGTQWLPPCGITRRSLLRALGELRHRGLIKTASNGRYTQITLNLDWTPEMLRVPKRFRQPSDKSESVTRGSDKDFFVTEGLTNAPEDSNSEVPDWHTRSAKLAQQKCQIGTPLKEKALKRRLKTEPSGAAHRGGQGEPSPESVPEAKPLTAVEAVAAGRTRAKRRRESDEKPRDNRIWQEAWLLTFPKSRPPYWGKAEFGMAKTLRKRAEHLGFNWADFFAWSIQNYPTLRSSQFGWMKPPPPMEPTMRFLLGMADRFFDAYADRETQQRLATDFTAEGEIEQLTRNGLSREEALIEIGKRKALAEHREAVERDKAEVARLFRAAERAGQAAPPPTRTQPPTRPVEVKHGSNPYDTGEVDVPQFPQVQEWEQ